MINSNINSSSSIIISNDSGPQLNSAANNSSMGRRGNNTLCRNTDSNSSNINITNSSSTAHPEDKVRAVTGAEAGTRGRV